jgi:hypothetical protein
MTGRPLFLRTAAISASIGAIPSRASTTKTTASASSMATMICSRTAVVRSDVTPGSKPPVSTTVACQRSKVTLP